MFFSFPPPEPVHAGFGLKKKKNAKKGLTASEKEV